MLHVILGGTFDPVHNGHLRLAVELHEMLDGARIHLMPCHRPPHRAQPGASGASRLAMLNAAIEAEPGLLVDDRELREDRVSYTADTLRQYRREQGDDAPLAIVTGSDAFNGFDQWRDWMQIPQLAHIIVVKRPGYPLAPGNRAANLLEERGVTSPDALLAAPSGRILSLELSLLDIAATDIRSRVRDGRSIRYLVPDTVWRHVHETGLYRPNTG